MTKLDTVNFICYTLLRIGEQIGVKGGKVTKTLEKETRHQPLQRILNFACDDKYRNGFTIDDVMENIKNSKGEKISERTARRYIETLLNLENQCIYKSDELYGNSKKAVYKFVSSSLSRFNTITESEVAALERISNNDSYNEQDRKDIKKVLSNVRKLLGDKSNMFEDNLELMLQTEGYAVRPTPKYRIDDSNIRAIRDAIRGKYKIRCMYENSKGEKKSRLLSPLGFLYGTQKIYLIARMDGKGDEPCTFLVHKLSDIRRGLDNFEPGDFDLKEYTNKSFGIWHDEEKILNVKLSFSQKVADVVMQYDFHPTQTVKKEDDGTVTVSFRACGESEILWHIFTWGEECTILEPSSLIEIYIKMLTNVLNKYK